MPFLLGDALDYSLDIQGGIASAAENMLSSMNGILPIALGIFAAIAGVNIGMKLFKTTTGTRT